MSRKFTPKYDKRKDYNFNAPDFFDKLGKDNELLKILSKRIWEYDQELAKKFIEWEQQIETLPAQVADMMNKWLLDGTLDQVINVDILNSKANQTDLTALDQKIATDLTTLKDQLTDELALKANQIEVDNLTNFTKNIKTNSYNVLDYGVVGDGITNDTQSLQSLLDTVQNGTVIFPKDRIYIIDDVVINGANTELFINNSTLKFKKIRLNGKGSGINGQNGLLIGNLKVAKLSDTMLTSQQTITLETNPFVVGDKVSSSYGMHVNDGSATVTAVSRNTITVDKTPLNNLPIGTYLGTYNWNERIILNGQDSYIKNVNIEYSAGYAIECLADSSINNVRIKNNGLDIMRLGGNNIHVNIDNSYFGFIFDPAKQAISAYQTNHLKVNNSHFERDNYDVELYIFSSHSGGTYEFYKCTFIGTKGTTHPAPYDKNSFLVVNFSADNDSQVDKIIIDNCEIVDYRQGVVATPYSQTRNHSIGTLSIKNSNLIRSLMGVLNYLTIEHNEFINNFVDNEHVYNTLFILSENNSKMIVKNNHFKRISCIVRFNNVDLIDNVFEDITERVQCRSNVIGYRNEFNEAFPTFYPTTDVQAVLRLYENIIDNFYFPIESDLNRQFNVNPNNSANLDFKFKGGASQGYLYKQNYLSKYFLHFKTVDGVLKGLHPYEFNIPVNSIIENITAPSGTEIKKVTKSTITATNTLNTSGVSTINVAGTYGMAVGDTINITEFNNVRTGKCHTAKVTAFTGTTVSINDPLPFNSESGSRICFFQYS